MRFYAFSSWSFSNDELSAIFRLNFDSLSDLFEEGIKIDGHPALVQLLLYFWSAIFGVSESITRLPFVLSGIAGSIYFYYFIKDFVNQKAALLSFSALTCSQLFILYSQIARPYSIGFFLVCAFAFYWFRLLNNPKSKKYLIGFILTGFLGIISHYFATMNICIMLFFGFFFIKKENYKSYLIGGIGICLLFLPHLDITLYQLKIGGVSWLPPPNEEFIYKFFLFLFNGTRAWQYLIVIFPLIALLGAKTNFKQWRIYLLPALFFLPYYIAYKYSINKTPVMQFSVLIFAAPFFIASFFSFFSSKSNIKLIVALSLIIITSGLYSLINERDFYHKKAFADFKGVSEKVIQVSKEISYKNLIHFSNTNNPEYLNYYYDQDSTKIRKDISQFLNLSYTKKARDIISESQSEYALISFANVPVPAEVYELVKQKYPEKVDQHIYFNSDASLFKKSKKEREKLFESKSETGLNWNINNELIDTANYYSSPSSFHIKPSIEYSFTYSDTIKNIFRTNNSFVVKGRTFMKSAQKVFVVFSIERNNESIYWRSSEIQIFYTKDEWFQFIHVFRKEDQILDSDLVKIYIWNPEKADFYLDDFELVNFKDSDYNYYEL